MWKIYKISLYNRIKDTNVEMVKCNHKIVDTNFSRLDYPHDKNIAEVEIDCNEDIPCDKVSVCNVIHDHS